MNAPHSKLGASSMHRWMHCPGSIRMCEGIEQPPSPYAEEGTIAHNHAAKMLEQDGFIPQELEDQLREALQTYREAIFADIADYEELTGASDHSLKIEERLDLSQIYAGCFGTADCILYLPQAETLHVYDFKYGAGVPVEVRDNPQLLYYAVGALLSLGSGSKVQAVETVIVQPRCFHPDGLIRRQRSPLSDILQFAKVIAQYAKATEDPRAPLVSGDHCRWCPAAGICPELRRVAEGTDFPVVSARDGYNPIDLANTLDKLDIIDAWVRSVREFAYQESLHGRTPPGYKLVNKRAHRRFREDVTPAVLMSKEWGLSEEMVYEKKMKSPAQIEKVLHPKAKDRFKALLKSESSGTVLVKDSDRRQALDNSAAGEFETIDTVDLLS